ncbi:MAG: helix-turn-helix transcriptional regulator [Ruminococcaceae bacterium]|nr:helix-turn-helix transcriptional regulator [Oscillospiraceae bacterium]
MELGKTIAALRKERGMTQEQLGQALGVSGQAVSKWEKGGAPDAELLPAIADRLGVTIDTLYGRENAPAADIRATLLRHLAAIPAEKRMDELFRLLCCTFMRPYYVSGDVLSELTEALFDLPVKSCYSSDIISHTEETIWLRSSVINETGVQLAVPAEDCPMFLLMPEPAGGYEANFADNDAYRALFSALALPGALEILRMLYAHKSGYHSAAAIAKSVGVALSDAERALPALCDCHLLKKTEVELEDAPVEVFSLRDYDSFVPFMLLSRWMCDKFDSYFCHWYDRDAPLLRVKEETHDESK